MGIDSDYVGSISLQKVGKRSQLNLDYAGGGSSHIGPLDADSGVGRNSTFHQLNVSQTVAGHRWELLVGNSLIYTPQSPAAFEGFDGLRSSDFRQGRDLSRSRPSLNPSFEPNQSILTGRVRQFENESTAEIQFRASKKSTVTAAAGYGISRFFGIGFIDSRSTTAQAGYNYALSKRDVVSVSYTNTFYQLDRGGFHVLERGVEVGYGHILTGRLSLEFSGGAQFVQSFQPQQRVERDWFWSTGESLNYIYKKGDVTLSYSRGVTAGSGVLLGAVEDSVQLGIGRELSRKWSGALDFGFARNQELTEGSAARGRATFRSWVGGFILSRNLGRRMGMFVDYHVDQQAADNVICSGRQCATAFHRQVAGFGLSWHGQPRRLR
jgi:hypothetical protein